MKQDQSKTRDPRQFAGAPWLGRLLAPIPKRGITHKTWMRRAPRESREKLEKAIMSLGHGLPVSVRDYQEGGNAIIERQHSLWLKRGHCLAHLAMDQLAVIHDKVCSVGLRVIELCKFHKRVEFGPNETSSASRADSAAPGATKGNNEEEA